jgi:nitroreductase
MDIYETIKKRCSVRTYRDEPVGEDKLHRILDAGRLSPSARNRQARKFIVVRAPACRKAIAKAAEQPWMAQAPVVIAVVGLTDYVMPCGVPADPVDCAIAIDHMVLAAVAEGLGTCWVGHFDQDACRKLLGVPAGATIIQLLTLGYAAAAAGGEKEAPKNRLAYDKVVCEETFRP